VLTIPTLAMAFLPPKSVDVVANWKPHLDCPGELIDELTRAVMALPAPFFERLCTGELFGSPTDALQRLNGFALTEGFAVIVIGGSNNNQRRYIRYICIY
jgi:hypothetical protein